MKKISNLKSRKQQLLSALFILLILCGLYVFVKNLCSSAFFQKKDRINVVFDGENAEFYSVGLDHDINYYISFYPDLEFVVPGGFGQYRSGAFAKLVSLEKDPDMYRKVFSNSLSNFVDFYFYPNPPNRRASASSDKIKIYFGEKDSDFSIPGLHLLFFGKSNANIFDRLFVFLQLFGKTKGQFKSIDYLSLDKQTGGTVFSNDNFSKKTKGNFYKKTYRKEEAHVQILYTKSYKTAKAIGQMIEGEGIRVADLSEVTEGNDTCQVTRDTNNFSSSATAISKFFHCKLIAGNTGAYDIIVKLGEVEKEWEIE